MRYVTKDYTRLQKAHNPSAAKPQGTGTHVDQDIARLPNLLHESKATATKRYAGATAKKFDAFLTKHYPGGITLASITSNDITQEMTEAFASYLFENPIGFSSSSTYLNSITSQQEEMTIINFFERFKIWYGRLRYGLRNRQVLKSNKEGVPTQVMAPRMMLGNLRRLASALFKTDKQAKLTD